MISERKRVLREAVLSASENIISTSGLGAMKARDIARMAGCSLGAIYTVFTDIDDLVLSVNGRTLGHLEEKLKEYTAPPENSSKTAVEWLVSLSLIYLDFAVRNRLLWLALFEHRLQGDRILPEMQVDRHRALFDFIEHPLRQIEEDAETRKQLARSLFSAVHGIVFLGLEEKLQRMSLETLTEQIRIIVSACVAGLLQGKA